MIKRGDPPADDRPIPGEGRLRRWSRLKQETRDEKAAPSPVAETGKAAVPAPAAAPEQEKTAEDILKDLPSIESLTKDSDYSVFMGKGVPDDMRARALEKLWASDPAFREPFPFEMHMEDYNATFVPIDALKDSVYRVGRGFLTQEELAEEAGEREKNQDKTEAADAEGIEAGGEKQAGTINQDDMVIAAPNPESSAGALDFPDKKEGKIAIAQEGTEGKPDKPA